MDVKKIVSQSKFAQVGFVVNDIEKAKKQFALLFGCEIPPTKNAKAAAAQILFVLASFSLVVAAVVVVGRHACKKA